MMLRMMRNKRKKRRKWKKRKMKMKRARKPLRIINRIKKNSSAHGLRQCNSRNS